MENDGYHMERRLHCVGARYDACDEYKARGICDRDGSCCGRDRNVFPEKAPCT